MDPYQLLKRSAFLPLPPGAALLSTSSSCWDAICPSGPSSHADSPPLQVDAALPPPLIQLVCSEDRCPARHLDSTVDKAAGPFLKTLQNGGETDKEQVSHQAHHTLCSLGLQKQAG